MEEKQKSEVAIAFGKALREARRASGLSQERLALESGVDRTFVSMLERGIRQPALATVLALCTKLATSPGALIERTESLMRKRAG
ncbi:MAG TPA: helix-turn-helix transcriptional regulator [Rhodanobacteraceae bacterium]|nr:helix-turn-helix transcriptional regulator [Rhodanobacteraceae bacterium]